MLKRPQIEYLVVGPQSARAPPQLRFQLVSDAASVQVTLQRASAPFGGQRSQVCVRQSLCVDHDLDYGGRDVLAFAVGEFSRSRSELQRSNVPGPA